MNSRLATARIIRWVAWLLALNIGCGSSKHFKHGTTYGEIVVESPQVFTRDRLINDRLREDAWLKKKLDESNQVQFGIQARLERMHLEGTIVGLGARRSPGLSSLEAAQGNRAVQNEGLQRRLDELDYEIAIARKQKELAALKADSVLSGNASGEEDGVPGPVQAPKGGGASTAALPPPFDAARLQNAFTNMASSFPGAVDVTPIDDLRERMSYREEIRNEIIKNELDDRHDLRGNTLYRWNFDVAVLPEHDTSAWAIVSVKVSPPQGMVDASDMYAEWARSVENSVSLELSRRLWDPSSMDRARALTLLKMAIFGSRGSPSVARLKIGDIERELLFGNLMREPDKVDAYQLGREVYIESIIEEIERTRRLGEYLQFARPVRGSTSLVVLEKPDAVDAFAKRLEQAPQYYFSYAVTPKESVQRVSDAMTSREFNELALSAEAQLGPVDTKALIDRIVADQLGVQTLKRQPLVVGFGDAVGWQKGVAGKPCAFGWILGPRFSTADDGKSVVFRHGAARYSLAAVVSVPAWWRSAKLEIACYWITEDGDTMGVRTQAYEVPLPGDVRELTPILTGRSARSPQPMVVDSYDVEGEKPATLLIRGENLWRNPRVTLGAQVTEQISVLPNMRGILVKFDQIAWLPAWDPKEGHRVEKVTVWTSEGDAFAGFVNIHPPVAKKN